MNYLTSTKSNPLLIDIILLVIRIFIGFAMLSHGFPKLQQLFSGEEIKFFDFLGLGPKVSLILTVFAEFVCSIFIILGLFTRFAVFFLVFTMAVAGLVVHSGDPFEKKEASLLYLSIYLLILGFGPGRYSIDHLITKRRETSNW
ncbi:DoxX family protein [Kaistella montana]|uniref:DoxX family protein n=1 Tax=Kaistella montana TaxID=1849733 RepID=A0ABW5K9R3_9FLAO|nr:DoxX family protein [Kaistella montana]MCQ4034821.1 DoxX family protein [Kaistella montana]